MDQANSSTNTPRKSVLNVWEAFDRSKNGGVRCRGLKRWEGRDDHGRLLNFTHSLTLVHRTSCIHSTTNFFAAATSYCDQECYSRHCSRSSQEHCGLVKQPCCTRLPQVHEPSVQQLPQPDNLAI